MPLLTMHNIFTSFRRKSESSCFSSVFEWPVLLSSYELELCDVRLPEALFLND